MEVEKTVAYISTNLTTKYKRVVTEVDEGSNCSFQQVEVSKTDYDVLVAQDCEYYKDLTHIILWTDTDRS